MKYWKYALYYFSFFAMYAIVTPNNQLYLASRGFDYDQIGIILGFFQVVGIAGPLIIGRLADRKHRYKYWLLFCLLIVPCIFFLMTLTTNFYWAIVIMSLMGIFMRPTVPLTDTLVSHSLDNPEEQYGKLRPAGSIGFLVMALVLDLTGFLKKDMSGRFPVIFAASMFMAAFILLFLPRASRFETEEKHKARPSGPQKFTPAFFLVLIALFFGWMAQAGYFSFYSLYLKEMTPIKNINIQWALGALFEIPVMFLSGWMIRRWGMKPLFIISLIVVSLRLLLYSFIPSPLILSASQILHAVTFGLFHAVGIAFINRYTPVLRKGLGMALYTAFLRSTSAFLGSMLGGFIAESHGVDRMFFWFSFLPLPGLLLILFWKEKPFTAGGKDIREVETLP